MSSPPFQRAAGAGRTSRLQPRVFPVIPKPPFPRAKPAIPFPFPVFVACRLRHGAGSAALLPCRRQRAAITGRLPVPRLVKTVPAVYFLRREYHAPSNAGKRPLPPRAASPRPLPGTSRKLPGSAPPSGARIPLPRGISFTLDGVSMVFRRSRTAR
jgi:hypothetical protein